MTTVDKTTKVYSTFDPRYIPGCIFWIDAADSSSLTISSGLVTQVRDKSVSANNAITLTSSPTYGTFSNGRPAISFNGGQGLQVSDVTKLPNGANSAHSFFSVAQSSTNAVQGIMTWGDYSLNDTMQYYFTTGGGAGAPGLAMGQFGRATTTTFDSTTVSGATMLNGNASSTSVVGWRNGNAFSNASTSGLVANISTTGSNIGCLNGTGIGPLTGRIGEIIIFNRTLPFTERRQVEGYLAWKWGIQTSLPAGHAYTNSGKHGPYLTMIRPTDFSNCAFWLDAADTNPNTSVTVSGTTVTAWKDKANNNTAIVDNTPQYSSTAINSRPGIQLTAINRFQFRSISNPINTNLLTIFGVAILSNSTNFGRIVSCAQNADFPNNVDFNQTRNIAIINPSTTTAIGVYRNGSTSSGNLGTNTPFMFTSISNATNNTLYINGTAQATPGTTVGTFTFDSIGIGLNISTRSTATDTWNGAVGEIIMYYTELTTQQQQFVEGYLSWKWGLTSNLPSTHPFKNFPPMFINP